MGWIDRFQWESPEQLQGYLAFVKWVREKGLSDSVAPIDLFFIQKDLESDVYWRELVGDQISRLEDQISILKMELREMKRGKE